ncbi:MAG: bifunctional alpha,alpha-trehalose-phosphate synthase (UDP-forming)/trehalose-phosphatase [Bacteriovoracaceae bacterium]
MSRCLLISNRLPITYDGKINNFKSSSGGLVSAIKGLDAEVVGREFEWMGILTDDIAGELIEKARQTPAGNLRCHPIVVPKDAYNHYYNEYCNNVIWPLFHYERSLVMHSERGWRSYCQINLLVAEAILAELRPDDIVWVHDFHLMLVPGILKAKNPKVKIGFFLHIPFPSSEIFRELPQRKEILQSLIKVDLMGFHDLSYMNHFRSSLQRVLGEISMPERALGAYPISIDAHHFEDLADTPETKQFIDKYKENKKNMKWILGVDRLDYIKGLVLKLRSFRKLLKEFPEERGKVQLVQIVIPSRTEVPEYQKLKAKIEQLVSSINGEFGTPAYMPISYLYHSVSEPELSALYQLSEVLHIGSTRDGMNLVSLEYIVSQKEKYPGVVLLSEFTGAHSTLSYAMSINPWNVGETARKMKEALDHPEVKRRGEISAMKTFLHRYNSSEWARIFLRDLTYIPQEKNAVILPQDGKFPWMNILSGKRIVIFCDLDGTLAPISTLPSDVRLLPPTINILKQLSETNAEFIVVSGRDQEFLEDQFLQNDFHFPMAACHGAYFYSPVEEEWVNLVSHDPLKWKSNVMEILKLYTSRTPGSFIEDKGHAVTWHYRNSPSEFADFLANKLTFELEETLTNQPAQVKKGKKVIEVRSVNANKGYFVEQWLSRTEYLPDIVIAIGDDTTDEDMFDVLQSRTDVKSFCIKVGKEKSLARYSLPDQSRVGDFLDNLVVSLRQHEAVVS